MGAKERLSKDLGDTDIQKKMHSTEWDTVQESPSSGDTKIVWVYTHVHVYAWSKVLVQSGGKEGSPQNSNSNQVQFPEREKERVKWVDWILNRGLYFIKKCYCGKNP